MEKFITLTSTVIPLPIENVDTDQIVPARFLKATDKVGFGDNLFADWRKRFYPKHLLQGSISVSPTTYYELSRKWWLYKHGARNDDFYKGFLERQTFQ